MLLFRFAKGEEKDDFKDIFTKNLELIVNGKDGKSTILRIGEESATGVDMTWDVLYNNGKEKIEQEKYEETECDCLAVLGDRIIMQACRYNQSGELYMKAYSVCHLTHAGKVSRLESFSDPDMLEMLLPKPLKQEADDDDEDDDNDDDWMDTHHDD